jgi:hypothetical protein
LYICTHRIGRACTHLEAKVPDRGGCLALSGARPGVGR